MEAESLDLPYVERWLFPHLHTTSNGASTETHHGLRDEVESLRYTGHTLSSITTMANLSHTTIALPRDPVTEKCRVD